MTRGWKPGDVALASYDGEATRFIRVRRVIGREVVERWESESGMHSSDFSAASWFRPLVVIDPEDDEQLSALIEAYMKRGVELGRVVNHHALDGDRLDAMRVALGSFISEPKPEEPTGLGAVVEAINDNRFVRVGAAGWVHEKDPAGESFDWDQIAAVTVISHGVTA